MEAIVRKYPRFVGAGIIVVGIVIAFVLKRIHDAGDSVNENTIILAPMCLVYGLAVILYPRLVDKRNFSSQFQYLAVCFSVAIVGVGLGTLVRYTVFKDWH